MVDDFLSATLAFITTSHGAASPPQALLEHFAWDDMFLKENHPDLIDIAHTDTTHLANRAACLRRLCVRRPTLFACLLYQTVSRLGDWLVASLTPQAVIGFTWPKPVRVARQALLLLVQMLSVARDVGQHPMTPEEFADYLEASSEEESWVGGSVTVKENPVDVQRLHEIIAEQTQVNAPSFDLAAFLSSNETFFERKVEDSNTEAVEPQKETDSYTFPPFRFQKALRSRLEVLRPVVGPTPTATDDPPQKQQQHAEDDDDERLSQGFHLCLLALPFVSGFTLPVARIVYPSPNVLSDYAQQVRRDLDEARRERRQIVDEHAEQVDESSILEDLPPVWLLRDGFRGTHRVSPRAKKLFDMTLKHRVTAQSPNDRNLNMHWDLAVGVWLEVLRYDEPSSPSGDTSDNDPTNPTKRSNLSHDGIVALTAAGPSKWLRDVCAKDNAFLPLFELWVESLRTIVEQGGYSTGVFPRTLVLQSVRLLRQLHRLQFPFFEAKDEDVSSSSSSFLRLVNGILLLFNTKRLDDEISPKSLLPSILSWVQRGLQTLWLGGSDRVYSYALVQLEPWTASSLTKGSVEALELLLLDMWPEPMRNTNKEATAVPLPSESLSRNSSFSISGQGPTLVLLQETMLRLVRLCTDAYCSEEQQRQKARKEPPQSPHSSHEPFEGEEDSHCRPPPNETHNECPATTATSFSATVRLLRLLDAQLRHPLWRAALVAPLEHSTKQLWRQELRSEGTVINIAGWDRATMFFENMLEEQNASVGDVVLLTVLQLMGAFWPVAERTADPTGGTKTAETTTQCNDPVLQSVCATLLSSLSVRMTSITWTAARRLVWAIEQFFDHADRSLSRLPDEPAAEQVKEEEQTGNDADGQSVAVEMNSVANDGSSHRRGGIGPINTMELQAVLVKGETVLRSMSTMLQRAYHGVPQLVFVIGESADRINSVLDEWVRFSMSMIDVSAVPASGDGGGKEGEVRSKGKRDHHQDESAFLHHSDVQCEHTSPSVVVQDDAHPTLVAGASDATRYSSSCDSHSSLLSQVEAFRALARHCAVQHAAAVRDDDMLAALRRSVAPTAATVSL